MASAGTSQNAAEAETGVDLPPFPSSPPRSTLRTSWHRISNVDGTIPFSIPGDSQREFIGVYMMNATSDPILMPLMGQGSGAIQLFRDMRFFELRLSSYGPMVQDEWIVDSINPSDLTICLITREGQG